MKFNFNLQNFLVVAPVLVVILLTIVTLGYAVSQVAASSNVHNPTVPTNSPVASNITSPALLVESLPISPSPIVGQTFDQASLALHNKSGDCYVAYAGVVYSVSDEIVWQGCRHHGVKGGQDITLSFPHPTNYLDTLPIVGRYTGPLVPLQGNSRDFENESFED